MAIHRRVFGLSLACGGVFGGIAVTLVLWLYPVFISDLPEVFLVLAAVGLPVAIAVLLVGRWTPLASAGQAALKRMLVVAALALLCTVVAFAARASDRSWEVSPRVLLFAIDGADAEIVAALGAAGDLPTLARLAESGASGLLESFDPSYSPVVWTSVATGVSPDAHGIQSFYSMQSQLRSKRIWEILQERGARVGVFRWWAVWPPTKTNGFLIPGVMAQDAQTWPADYEFLNRLRIERKAGRRMSVGEALSYSLSYLESGLRLRTAMSVALELAQAWRSGEAPLLHVAMRRAELRMSADVYGHLLRRFEPEYTSFYDNGIDIVSHDYWKFFEPEGFDDVTDEDLRLYRDVIPEHYRLVDEVLGELLEHVDPSTHLVFLSDHGFRSSASGQGSRLIPLVQAVLEDLGVQGEYRGISVGNRTYVEPTSVGAETRQLAADRVAELLGDLRIEETGEAVFEVKVLSSQAVRLDVSPRDDPEGLHVAIDDRLVPFGEWVSPRPGRSGDHDLFGILRWVGPGVVPGRRMETARMVDIAPTVLYVLQRPVSREMEGRVLEEALQPSMLARHPVRWVDSYGSYEPPFSEESPDDARMEEILRSLGYVQ